MSEKVISKFLTGPTLTTGPEWYQARRDKARRFAQAEDIPTQKLERWRYTAVYPVAAKSDFIFGAQAERIHIPESVLEVDAIKIVLVNGQLSVPQSGLTGLPEGVRVSSLTDALVDDDKSVQQVMESGDSFENNAFRAANDADPSQGLFISVAAGRAVSTPLHIISVVTPATESENGKVILTQPRVLVNVGQGAELTLIESYVSTDANLAYFQNILMQVHVAASAHVKHIKWQDESRLASHVSTVDAVVKQDATYVSFIGHSGAALARHDVRIAIDGRGAHAEVNGVYLGDNGQHHDITSVIDHRKPQATSNQMVRGVLQTGASGVFLGKAVVAKDAQKTDARQLHNALLLDQTAHVSSKPELEIYADDVQCAHGNTVGDIDQMALFYMEARGIHRDVARRMLIEGFMTEVVESGVPEHFQKNVIQKVLEAIK